MSDNITKPTALSVDKFINDIPNYKVRSACHKLIQIMRDETGVTPRMWGSSIIGFGSYHYKYASGRQGDTLIVGFSPRVQALTLYGIIFYDENTELLNKLGKHTTGKGCLYIKDLADIDEKILSQMIKIAYRSKQKA